MNKRRIFFIAVLLLMSFFANAQASLTLSVSDKVIGSQDQLQATYSFKNVNLQSAPSLEFNDWDADGPSISNSTTIINGAATSSVSFSYTLMPKKTGKLTVPGLNMSIGGKQLSCNSVQIKVDSKRHVASQNNGSAQQNPLTQMPNLTSIFGDMGMGDDDNTPPPAIIVHNGQTVEDAAKDKLFIKVITNKQTCYLGEPILGDYELYSGLQCQATPVRYPSFTSFSVTDINQALYPYNTQVNGHNFTARPIRKAQLVALKTGDILLDSAFINCLADYIYSSDPTNFHTGNILIKSNPTYIHVLPLPTKNKPLDYFGGIGNFSITASVDKNVLPANENNTLHITITGTGNLDGVILPNISWPKNIQSYDSKDSQSVDKSQFPMPRTLTYDIPFIGSAKGSAVIPSIKFSYFDTQKNDYVTVATDSIKLSFSAPISPTSGIEQPIISNAGSQKYLWIIAGIAIILLIVFLIREKTANKKKTVAKSEISTAIATPSQIEIKPEPTQEEIEQAILNKQNLIAEKKEKFKDSIMDLELETDNHQFFILAKALLIQYLQDKTHSNSTEEYELLNEFKSTRQEESESISKLLSKCNKALYMPVVSDLEREDVLRRLKVLSV